MTTSAERVGEVLAALEVALADFQRPSPVELRLEVHELEELIMVRRPDGSATGVVLEPEDSGAVLLVRVADVLQDQVFDQLEQTWGEARPPCPGHQHPANPELLDEDAWWVCPRSRERIGRIGRLTEGGS